MKYTREEYLRYKLPAAIIAALCILVLIGYAITKRAPVAPTPAVVAAPPAQVTEPVVQAPPLPTIYRIKKGDTLSKIARNSCNTVLALAKQNFIKNPDKIYAGKKLTFVKSETCSPESAKSSTFPEKRLDRPSVRASQEKLLHSEPKSDTKKPAKNAKKNSVQSAHQRERKATSAAAKTPITQQSATPRPAAKEDGCADAGAGIADYSKRVLAQAECVKRLYGEFIKDAVLQDPRISHIDVVAVMLHESNGNPKAVSRSTVPCLGLMQLQTPTAIQYGVNEKMIFDPRENIRGSVRILSAYTYRYFNGSRDHGLAAYNRGPHSKVFTRKDFDPNTLRYVQSVKKISEILTTHRYAL